MGERALQNRIMKLREIEAQQKALKAALPEIYGQYCKSSAIRRFTIV